MCVLSIKVPIRKKSGNLFNDPHKFTTYWVLHTSDLVSNYANLSKWLHCKICKKLRLLNLISFIIFWTCLQTSVLIQRFLFTLKTYIFVNGNPIYFGEESYYFFCKKKCFILIYVNLDWKKKIANKLSLNVHNY